MSDDITLDDDVIAEIRSAKGREEQLALLGEITELVAAGKCDALALAASNNDGTVAIAWRGPTRSVHFAAAALTVALDRALSRSIPEMLEDGA